MISENQTGYDSKNRTFEFEIKDLVLERWLIG